jgi:hypothetical protein
MLCISPDRARYDLLSPGLSSKLGGSAIVLSCVPLLGSPSAVLFLGSGDPTPTPSHSAAAAPSANIAVAQIEQDQVQLEALVHSAAAGSHLSTPSGLDTAGTVMANVSAAATSNSFGIVMGFLEKLVNIGDTIAEVS